MEIYKNRNELIGILPKRSVGCEIGVMDGNFSQVLLDAVNPIKLVLIDAWEYRQDLKDSYNTNQEDHNNRAVKVYKRFSKHIQDNTINIFRIKSQDSFDIFPDQYFDWIYVDGEHTYDGLKSDLFNFSTKIKPGGYFIIDDYNSHHSGVKTATDEFCKSTGRRISFKTEGNGSINVAIKI